MIYLLDDCLSYLLKPWGIEYVVMLHDDSRWGRKAIASTQHMNYHLMMGRVEVIVSKLDGKAAACG